MELSTTSLGQHTDYPQHYAPEVLEAIARAPARHQMLQLSSDGDVDEIELPFKYGCDVWQAYELSWLNTKGKPCVAMAHIKVPFDSPAIVESKSLKLYLNSLNQHRLNSANTVQTLLSRDLSKCVQAPVEVQLKTVDYSPQAPATNPLNAHLIDDLDVEINHYVVDQYLLHCTELAPVVAERLCSHLLRSCCPVTAQPDWASLLIEYKGPQIDRAALLRYIVSYRNNQEFHEQCIERMFIDIFEQCKPSELTIAGYYTRRGGIDINPIRATHADYSNELPLLPRQ